MNTLSWLLYAADVTGNVSIAAEKYVFFAAVFYGLYRLAVGFFNTMEKLSKDDDRYVKAWTSKKLSVLWFVALAMMLFVPDPKTVYLIAASEAGEYVATTERAGRFIDKIEQAIDQQLETDTEE